MKFFACLFFTCFMVFCFPANGITQDPMHPLEKHLHQDSESDLFNNPIPVVETENRMLRQGLESDEETENYFDLESSTDTSSDDENVRQHFNKPISLNRATTEPTPNQGADRIRVGFQDAQRAVTRKQVCFESGFFQHRSLIFDDTELEGHGLSRAEPRQVVKSGLRFFSKGILEPMFRPLRPFRGFEGRDIYLQPGTRLK